MQNIGRASSTILLALLLGSQAAASGVVGFKDLKHDAWFAVRGKVAAGSILSGVDFYANDATLYPEIAIVADKAVFGLPQFGGVVRSVSNVRSVRGANSIELAPYSVEQDSYIWALIRLPDAVPFREDGVHGGPGIRWRETRELDEERSFFGADGATSEFLAGFEISLRTSGSAKPGLGGKDSQSASEVSVTVETQGLSRARFAIALPQETFVRIDLYDVSGRHIDRILEGVQPSGSRVVDWPGVNSHGRAKSSGVYFYRVAIGTDVYSGRVVLVK